MQTSSVAGPSPRRVGAVVVMAKDPRDLPVKTRLAASIGQEAALGLYRAFILDLISTVEAAGLVPVIALHPFGRSPSFPEWLGLEDITVVRQEGKGFGRRMVCALMEVKALGHDRAVAVGCDVPDLPRDRLVEALRALDDHDAVIDPSDDGGFHLIGLRGAAHDPTLLDGISWGTDRVMEQATGSLSARGLTVKVLSGWRDVDDLSDLHALEERLTGNPRAAPLTKKLLDTIEPPVERERDHPPLLSVIIPVLHEEEVLARVLEHTRGLAGPRDLEIILVDGDPDGSSIGTISVEGVRTMVGPRGRGIQMNAGASIARGRVLLFLHADTLLPRDAFELVRAATGGEGLSVGAFDISYGDHRRVQRWMGKLGTTRARLRGMPYGDHALFMTRQAFEELGGYADVPIMEDVDIVRRAKRKGMEVRFVDAAVTTSDRRFLATGFWRNNIKNLAVIMLFHMGVPPRILARFYPPEGEYRPRLLTRRRTRPSV